MRASGGKHVGGWRYDDHNRSSTRGGGVAGERELYRKVNIIASSENEYWPEERMVAGPRMYCRSDEPWSENNMRTPLHEPHFVFSSSR
ncbi:hypothetical protein L1887_03345 [Cichorium endivia]|nr:hypothetical protein L1887_03345 [Cichorium endivia]